MKTVRFHFDFVSPYSWLAVRRLDAFAKKSGCEFEYVPVLLAGLLAANDNKGPAEVAMKRDYVFKDVLRECQQQDLKPRFPPAHPFNPLNPLRMVTAVDSEKRGKVVQYLFDLSWNQGKEISDPAVLETAAKELNLPWGILQEAMKSEQIKLQLRRNTELALSKGVFGVPTFEVDGELFWGNDRLEQLLAHLRGDIKLPVEYLQDILKRPVGARRR